MHYLTTNYKLESNPTNGKDYCCIVYERPLEDQNPPDTLVKLIPCPVNCETPVVKEKWSYKNRLSNRTDSYLSKEFLNPNENISGEQETATVISPTNCTKSNSPNKKIGLTIELTYLQLFVKEQLFIIRKQLAENGNIQEPVNLFNWK